jgi:hypothetical protein
MTTASPSPPKLAYDLERDRRQVEAMARTANDALVKKRYKQEKLSVLDAAYLAKHGRAAGRDCIGSRAPSHN